MQTIKIRQTGAFWRTERFLLFIAALVVLLTLAGYMYNSYRAFQPPPALEMPKTISLDTLENEYGLKVNLVAVTAAGGMIDLRLRIIDGDKAKEFLSDSKNYPVLRVGNGVVLKASEDMFTQVVRYENGASIFALYPNSGNIVKPGDPVNIVFGELQVEALPAK